MYRLSTTAWQSSTNLIVQTTILDCCSPSWFWELSELNHTRLTKGPLRGCCWVVAGVGGVSVVSSLTCLALRYRSQPQQGYLLEPSHASSPCGLGFLTTWQLGSQSKCLETGRKRGSRHREDMQRVSQVKVVACHLLQPQKLHSILSKSWSSAQVQGEGTQIPLPKEGVARFHCKKGMLMEETATTIIRKCNLSRFGSRVYPWSHHCGQGTLGHILHHPWSCRPLSEKEAEDEPIPSAVSLQWDILKILRKQLANIASTL